MGKKVTYERWINLFLPDGWTEREELGSILLEKENWPGMIQVSFIERDGSSVPHAEAARMLLEDTLEEREIPFPREAVLVEDLGDHGVAVIDYTFDDKDEPAHWRIWALVDPTRALLAAYVCDPAFDHPHIDEASRIVADIEFLPAPASA